MATDSLRRQKRHQINSMPLSEHPTIGAWTTNHHTLESRGRDTQSLHYNPRFATAQRSNCRTDFNTGDSECNIKKPTPPAHGIAPRSWNSVDQYSTVMRPASVHQGNTMKRTMACHPRRIDGVDGLEVKELMRIDPLHLFFTGFLPPFFGAVASIVVALILHNDEISNYNWQCGRARLPSLSRIINLPMERIFWQFTFLFHIPLRLVELAVGYLHVIFFYAFGSCAIGFFITNVICHASSLYYLNPYGRISYHIKLVVLVLYIISVPILLGAFILYWKRCITVMYDVFAITEYVDVFLSIAYHCCAFYDIRWKVIFSIRSVKHTKYD